MIAEHITQNNLKKSKIEYVLSKTNKYRNPELNGDKLDIFLEIF